MNDLDRATFAQFAERFGRIERRIPAPPPLRVARSPRSRGLGRVSPRTGLVAIGIVLVASIGFAAIGAHPSPAPSPSPAHVSVPPDSAGPAEVFEAYLRALQAGDCNTAHLLGDPQLLTSGFADLCTTTQVTAFSIIGDPVVESPYRVRVRANISITGFDQETNPEQLNGFYWLQHQSSGAWRISDGAITLAHEQVPTLPPLSSSQPAGFLAPYPPQAVVDSLLQVHRIVVAPMSAADLAQVTVDRVAAVRTAMASRGIGIPGPNSSGEVVWTNVGFVYLATYTSFGLPAYGGPQPSPAPFPAYLVQVLAPPFPGFPGQNSALVIVDARSGEQDTTFGPCDGALCGLP
jgi:hypothetical protein